MIQLGSLVRSPHNDLGVGKVTETSDLDATVEYFYSVGQRTSTKVPLSSLEPVRLQRQTRCYLWSDQEWLIGRIFGWDDDRDEYQIDLPDKKSIFADEEEIYVRCDRPIEEPIETLALKGHETPYFHNQRSPFVKCLIQQRAVSRGMTGLISANIDLYPHQVEVVRRVLEDPIQRYLLADEVGLGKTIEAGAILRQYLLDESHGRVVVLVPQYLLEQWRQELEDKFYLSHFGKRVQLIAVEDVEQVSFKSDLGLLILDEAHHIAAMATASNRIQRQSFETCKRLAHQSERLLLLSATPVLNHEQDFLAMLHLLDPITYKLDDLEGFRDRVQKRQEIGRVLLSFKEDAKPFVLKKKLGQIKELFAEDQYLLGLTDELASCLQQETPASEREQIVRAIRTHISDTYRLHRRMLRNRRASVEDVIFERNATPKLEYDLDERSPDIHELIDEWRTVAPDEQYSRIFLLLFRASGTSFSVLKAVVAARLNGVASAELRQDFGADDVRILVETSRFAGEAEILQSLLKTLQQPSEDGDRVELLRMMLLNQLLIHFKIQGVRASRSELIERLLHRIRRPLAGDHLPKIVVFTSFTPVCAEIVQCLSNTFGEKSVASHQFGKSRDEVEENLIKFRCQPECFMLVCDPSGEEGRNLQFAEQLIHFDLPWSPNRLEQRIGRLDRIGSKMGVQSWVFAGPDLEDSPQDAWYRLLKDGFGIFQQSIASLQFYVDEKLPQLELTLFQSGAAGLLEAIESIQQEITAEQLEISEQNALDEIDALDETATQYFRSLDDYDGHHQELQRATEGWVCQALNFWQLKDPNLAGVLRYQPTTRTLVPLDDLRTRFASRVEQSGTYNRRIANQNSGVKIYRVGEEFTQALASYIRWDDRGQAFAMWRHDEAWDAGEGMEWVGFQFDYLIETDLEAAKRVMTLEQDRVNHRVLERRADALLPPRLETIFLDAQLTVVEDQEILNILQRPYKDKSAHCRDYNLAKNRLSVLDEFVDANEWPKFCRTARSTSEELLRDRPSFVQFCQQQAKSAEQKLTNRTDQLRLRLNRLVSTERVSNSVLEQELSNESALSQALVEGVRHPRISLDSVGFIIVSGRPLQSQEDGDYS